MAPGRVVRDMVPDYAFLVMCAILGIVCFIGLHAMYCPGRRWGLHQAATLARLLSELGMDDDTWPEGIPLPEREIRADIVSFIGDLVTASDDMGMHKWWGRYILARVQRDQGAAVACLTPLNERSIWLAQKARRCHFTFLPHHWFPVTRAVRWDDDR